MITGAKHIKLRRWAKQFIKKHNRRPTKQELFIHMMEPQWATYVKILRGDPLAKGIMYYLNG